MRLTSRGAGLILAGAGLALCASIVQSLTAARLATVCLAIPAIALTFLLISQLWRRPQLSRTLPTSWQVEVAATVQLSVSGGVLPPFSSLREQVPTSLRRHATEGTTYQVRPSRRGRVTVGPAVLHRGDPFAIVTLKQVVSAATTTIVWPQTFGVDTEVVARSLAATRQHAHGMPQRALDDVALRDYRIGDDMHRVHWPSSARRGNLMVRHDEPVTTNAIDVVLLLSDHDDAVAEWCVSAAASIATALLQASFRTRIVTTSDNQVVAETAATSADALDVFALAEPVGDRTAAVLRSMHQPATTGVIAVVDRPQPATLAQLDPASAMAFAVITDPHGALRAAATELAGLDERGWHHRVVTGSESIPAVWGDVTGAVR